MLGLFLQPKIEICEPLETIKRVTPALMSHLKREHRDIHRVSPDVFEQIIAELLAAEGWQEVKLVGRSRETSADILAGYYLPGTGSRIRVFIETKRWKERIGVEVFNSVLGAMISEREVFGWHMAWVVALGGATKTRKFSHDEWRLKGLEVKTKSDILRWLEDYSPNANGLWLPPDILAGD